MAKNKPITGEHWIRERQDSWDALLGVLREAVKLAFPERGWKVLMFPHVSDLFWGSFFTQVSPADFASETTVEEWHHEPLGFLSGVFKGSQLRLPPVEKEDLAIVRTFQRLDYLLWGEVNVYCDHCNMT